MNTKGRLAVELLVMLIGIVGSSALILFLVQSGIIVVHGEAYQEPILNAEFIPTERVGNIVINQFSFCQDIGEKYKCVEPTNTFRRGDKIHFRFEVETTPYQGEVKLIENYRLKDPKGVVILDVDEESNFHYDIVSAKKEEKITFKDYFIINSEASTGEYTLELVMSNPLINKKVTRVEKVQVNE